MRLLRIALMGVPLVLSARVVPGGNAAATISTAQQIDGTWVLQQVSGRDELDRLVPTTISPALKPVFHYEVTGENGVSRLI